MYISFIIYWIQYGYYYLLGFLPEITYDIEIDHTDKYLKIISNELERLVYTYIYRYVMAYITVFYIQPEWVFFLTMTAILLGPSVVRTLINLIILFYVIIWYGSIILLKFLDKNHKYYYHKILNKLNVIFILWVAIINVLKKNYYAFIYYYFINFLISNIFIIKQGNIKHDIYGNELILIKKTNLFFFFSLYLFEKISSYLHHLVNFRVDWRTIITYSSSKREGEPLYTKDGRALEDYIVCFPSIEGLKIKHKIKKLKIKNRIKRLNFKYKTNKFNFFKNRNKNLRYGIIRKFKLHNFLLNKSFIIFIFKNYRNISIFLVFSSFIFIGITNIFYKLLKIII